tara:strand:+ start:843 stop:1304 length:462 start_codon:yes stop_codon:yes gene_type:complete
MSTLFVDTINEKTSGNGVQIPGHVVQVVTNTATSTITANSTSNVDVISVSITPKSSSSVIHIEGYMGQLEVSVGSSNAYATVSIEDPSGNQLFRAGVGQSALNSEAVALLGIHSPSSTSSQTYTMKMSTGSGGTGSVHTNTQRYTIKATEIAQ